MKEAAYLINRGLNRLNEVGASAGTAGERRELIDFGCSRRPEDREEQRGIHKKAS